MPTCAGRVGRPHEPPLGHAWRSAPRSPWPAHIVAGVVIALCAAVPAAWADENVWTSTGPVGGQAVAFAISGGAAPVVYAATSGGVFRSTDAGGSWLPPGSGLTNSSVLGVAVDPQNAQVVYAGTDGSGVFKSTDGGATWQAASGGFDKPLAATSVAALVVDPGNSQVVYAATLGSGVFKSGNAGVDWSAVENGLTSP